MTTGQKLTKTNDEEFSNPTLYRSMVGALQYAIVARPETAFAVTNLDNF